MAYIAIVLECYCPSKACAYWAYVADLYVLVPYAILPTVQCVLSSAFKSPVLLVIGACTVILFV